MGHALSPEPPPATGGPPGERVRWHSLTDCSKTMPLRAHAYTQGTHQGLAGEGGVPCVGCAVC